MIKVTAENYSIIKETIERAPTFVYSILDQVIEGAVYADNESLHSLLFQTKSGIYYVYGDSSSEQVINKLAALLQESIEESKRFTLFSYSDEWSAKIEQRLNDYVNKLERYNFSFDINAYNNREKRESLDYECIKIKQPQIDHSLEFDNQYYEDYWDSTDNFLEKGFGFCLQHENKIISEAVSIFRSHQFAEIDIITDANYRGKGLASFIAEKFIDDCLLNDLQPCWDCDIDNNGSYHLGVKLGFTNPIKYPVFYKKTIDKLTM
ncbi:GNAT family N-acetyltransferase [Lysinibacillus sp. KCTC 33748]|uniref:GNAT family N-acetyltransferase n=1 Tax=unclassified Lysinibacillus TaxID=2636778 RepID=UPI0009A7A9C3|nr:MULTISPECIES: GNAT family N-acetyltransferase [unclassified Lysinibacillus]OXS75500.1 GNAT family N-acetyltransferase [Lysinibacillus sp. KCTC 33748]SKB54286.1 GNAT acetyltransferase [Lysinibacillus sp. AC-3]